MINNRFNSTIRRIYLAILIAFFFSNQTAYSQIYEFRTVSFNKEGTSSLAKVLNIDQTTGKVKVSFILGSMNNIVLDTKIGNIFENNNSEIVIQNTDNEPIVAVFVNNSGSEGYFIYHDDADNKYYKVILSKPENYLATFKKLKQAVQSGAAGKLTPKNSAGTTSAVTASSPGRLPAKGTKTADILASHPFGFLPPNCLSESEIKKAIKEEGWPEAKWYRADLNFKVPYTIYGTKVWSVDWSFINGQLSWYEFDTYEMTGNVTDKRILDYVGLFLADLKKIGYEIKSYKPDKTEYGTYHEWSLSNGKDVVEILTNFRGKIFFKVYLNSAKK